MEKKNDSTLLLLLAAGLGVYWLTRKKPMQSAVTIPADQGNISTQPVIEQPITTMPIIEHPIYSETISTQPVSEQPIYVAPTMEAETGTSSSITDMFNTVWQTNYVDKTPIDAVYNMNIQPIE